MKRNNEMGRIATGCGLVGLLLGILVFSLFILLRELTTSRGRFIIRTADGQVIHAVRVTRAGESSFAYTTEDGREGVVSGNFVMEEIK